MRGGATLESVVEELGGLIRGSVLAAAVEAGNVGDGARLPPKLEVSAPARCAALTALSTSASAPWRISSPRRARPLQRDPDRRRARAVAEDALRWREEGYRTFKLKLGVGDDAAQVRAVREALGAEAQIRVDANAAWDLETARRVLAEIEPLGIQLVEQPVATHGARRGTGTGDRRSRSPGTRASRPPMTPCAPPARAPSG